MPAWVRWVTLPLDLLVGLPLLMVGTVVFVAYRLDAALVRWPSLRQAARWSTAVALVVASLQIGWPLALMVTAWAGWRLLTATAPTHRPANF